MAISGLCHYCIQCVTLKQPTQPLSTHTQSDIVVVTVTCTVQDISLKRSENIWQGVLCFNRSSMLCLFFNSNLLSTLRHGSESFLPHTDTILITRLLSSCFSIVHLRAISGSHCPGKMYNVSSRTTCTKLF